MNYVSGTRTTPFKAMADGTQGHVMLGRILSGYPELVIELGGNADALLAGAGLARRDLQLASALVPVRSAGQLLEDSATRLGCPDFGLRLAERQTTEAIMQPLDRLFRTAPTIRDALEYCSRHVGAFNSGLVMDVDSQGVDGYHFEAGESCGKGQGSLHMVDFKLLDGLSLFPQLMEQLLLMTHNSIVWLSAGFARSRMIWFSHLNISPPVAYARRFNTIIKFGQEYDAILFSDDDLETKVAECNAELFASEARLVEELFPARDWEIDARVRQAIFRSLTRSEECNRQNIARMLGFQERTLNRHLYKKGTSFEAIRDEVRRDLAFRYLARADLSLSDIAGRLGYSEMAVLSRCCRRWFGTSPRQLRQNLLAFRSQAVPSGKLSLEPAKSWAGPAAGIAAGAPNRLAANSDQPISIL